MGKIQDDELADELRRVHRQAPCDHAAPVVADDDGVALPEVLDDGDDVADEQLHVVVGDAGGLVAVVVATLIDGHDLEAVGEAGHLMPPAVPEIREAVNHHDQRAGAHGRVVDFHAG